MIQADVGSVIVWSIFSWHILDNLVPIEHHYNTAALQSIVADYLNPFVYSLPIF